MTLQTQSPRRTYRQHSKEFKRQVVLQTLEPGVSVARVAIEHAVNANQVFAWRKAYYEGQLGDCPALGHASTLIPVSVIDLPCYDPSAATSKQTGIIVLERGNDRLRLEGLPDLSVLKLVLAQWFSK
jgi:transposase